MERVPEPELMDTPEQTAAYAEADFSEANDLFVSHMFAHHLPDFASVIDLGCGPGDIVVRLACRYPHWQLTALDGGENMLARAEHAIDNARLSDRVSIVKRLLPDVSDVVAHDAVISNSLLHHLPEPDVLWAAIRSLLIPGGVVQVMDLLRPDNEAEVDALVAKHAANHPSVLQQDFRNSLFAAYTLEEVKQQLDDAGLDLHLEQVSDRHWMARGRP